MNNQFLRRIVLVGATCMATSAVAAPITFTGSSGTQSAKVVFDIVGGNLQVTLTNTGAFDDTVPADILTAVFFKISGDPALSRVSATAAGPTYTNYGTNASTTGPLDVGTHWGYSSAVSIYGANSGIGAAGFGIFGPPTAFEGSSSPQGVDYGLLSAVDNPTTGNGGLSGSAFTKNSDVFLLGTLPGGFSLSNISNITFQYGSATTELSFGGSVDGGGAGNGALESAIPEPGTLSILGLGVLTASLLRRRNRR